VLRIADGKFQGSDINILNAENGRSVAVRGYKVPEEFYVIKKIGRTHGPPNKTSAIYHSR